MSEYSYIGYSSDKIVICLIIICLHRYSYMNRHMIIPLNHIWVHMSVHILILIYVTHISVTYMNSLILIYEYTCMSTHICVHIYVYSYMSIKMLISLLIYDPNIWVPIYDYRIWVLIYMTTIWYSYMSHVSKNTYTSLLYEYTIWVSCIGLVYELRICSHLWYTYMIQKGNYYVDVN